METQSAMNSSVRYGLFCLAIAAAIGYVARDFLLALSWGALLAISLYPLHQMLRSKIGLPAWLSVTAISTGMMALVILPLTFLAIQIIAEIPAGRLLFWTIQDHGITLPASLTGHTSLWSHVSPVLQKWGLASPEQPAHLSVPDHIAARIAPVIQDRHTDLIHMALSAGKHTTHLIEQALFTFIGFVSFLAAGSRLTQQIKAVSEALIGANGPEHVMQMGRAIRGTVTGIVLIGIIQGLLISIALVIWHCPHPALFTAAIIAAGLIPFCAPVAVAAAVLTTLVAVGSAPAIAILAWGMAVISISDHVIKPRLVGHSTSLGFLSSMVAILGGMKTMGLIGIFIGPALFALGASIWNEFTDTSRNGNIVE